MDRSCVYIEYPKCLYNPGGSTMVVDNGEEEDSAKQMGWMTAEQYHSNPASAESPVPAPAEPSIWPDSSNAMKTEGENDSPGPTY